MIISAYTRLQGFVEPRSMGVVSDVLFINCYWPKLDRPTRLFAPGSSLIKVLGRTPRNVWFPDDTEFVSYYPDAIYPAEQAVFKAFPFNRRGLINLAPAEALVWWEAYNAAVATFPPTHAVHPTTRSTNFLRHREVESSRTVTLQEDRVITAADGSQTIIPAGTVITKRKHREFVAEMTPAECRAMFKGEITEADLRAAKTFVDIEMPERTREQWLALKAAGSL